MKLSELLSKLENCDPESEVVLDLTYLDLPARMDIDRLGVSDVAFFIRGSIVVLYAAKRF